MGAPNSPERVAGSDPRSTRFLSNFLFSANDSTTTEVAASPQLQALVSARLSRPMHKNSVLPGKPVSAKTSLWTQIAYRMGLALLGLFLFYLFGLSDTNTLFKAAVFSLMVNVGLAGTLQSWGHVRLASRLWLGFSAVFFLSAAIKGFLFLMYGMTPKDALVIEALAGTTSGEISEFLALYWRTLLLIAAIWLVTMAALVGFECFTLRRWAGALPTRASHWRSRLATTLVLLLLAGLHANRTVANENPLVYWPGQYTRYEDHQKHMAMIGKMMADQEKDVSDDPVSYYGADSNTVVLIIGESVNRANWSLYGYPRQTTPNLDKMRDELLVFKDVISADAATSQSLLKMLTPATIDHPELWAEKPSILALAKRAGYKVEWLSNQERSDGWIQLLAGQADEQVFINNGSGRSITSLDELLIPVFEKALLDPAPRKFIIIHMQGAHLRYDLRYPEAFNRFTGDNEDSVSREMEHASRSFWIRNARNEYDNAMLYGDYVLSRFLKLADKHLGNKPAQLMYVSDHGQEVGHNRDFAGHSKLDPSGYEIPVFLWSGQTQHSGFSHRGSIENRAYQADRIDNTLLALLQIGTDYYDPRDDLLSASFQPVKRMQGAAAYVATHKPH